MIAILLLFSFMQEEKPKVESPWSVSGTLSTDISALSSKKHERDVMPDEGVTGEFSLGATYAAGHGITVTIRSCVGCHGFELQNAYADVELAPDWTLRVGRLPVPFGSMSRRTNPAHMEASTRPLPYIMGGMVRKAEFNQGIVPAPFSDNGAAVMTSTWVTADVQMSFEAAIVRGLKGTGPDFDFAVSRDFEDTNGQPAGAVRVTTTAGFLEIGFSAMTGRYDPGGELDYFMSSVDLTARWAGLTLRMEGVGRITEFLAAPDDVDESRRTGFAVQADYGINAMWRVFFLHDGLRVENVFLSTAGPLAAPFPGSTDDSNTINRYTTGFVATLRPGLILKGSAERWIFSDFPDAWVFHVSMVVEY